MALNNKRSLRMLVLVLLLGGLGLLGYEAFYWLTHVYESGARVQTELTRMSSRVDGSLDRVLVAQGDRVHKGQKLIALDDKDISLRIDALRTDLELEGAERDQLVSERHAFEIELESRIAIGREQIRAGEIKLRTVTERLRLAEKDLARLNVLFNKKLASEAQLASEQAKVLTLRSEASVSAADIDIARRELDQVRATEQQLAVVDDKIRISAVTTDKIKAMIAIEENQLAFRHIRSPIDGVVARVYKYPGEFVEEGEIILILHDQRLFWLEAYIDEDQIRHVRVDQNVIIEFNAYPFDEYSGRIRQIGSVTTLQMGISDGQGGQFGRASERVPVQISIDEPPPVLTPGMRADINVEIGNRLRNMAPSFGYNESL